MYTRESTLLEDFMAIIAEPDQSPWGPLNVITEFHYSSGRTDIVGLNTDGDVIAFEGKLTKWWDAMHQAYRNTCFANRTYIVVPEETAYKAILSTSEFLKRSVGICYVCDGVITIIQEAPRVEPLLPNLSGKAIRQILQEAVHGDHNGTTTDSVSDL